MKWEPAHPGCTPWTPLTPQLLGQQGPTCPIGVGGGVWDPPSRGDGAQGMSSHLAGAVQPERSWQQMKGNQFLPQECCKSLLLVRCHCGLHHPDEREGLLEG